MAGVAPSGREERTIRGRVVHALLEWSQGNGWQEPPLELLRESAAAEGLDPDRDDLDAEVLGPVRQWLGSSFLRERVGGAGRVRAEVPLLLAAGGTVLRGSIDLLVEREGAPPLVVDYKTDRLAGVEPQAKAEQYGTQRAIYALAVAEALAAEEVEVAYVFLERADQPVLARVDRAEVEAGRVALGEAIGRIGRGEFPVAEPERRDWELCRECPALRGLCSGPRE